MGLAQIFEAKFLPLIEARRFRRCSVLKAVHLSAAIRVWLPNFYLELRSVCSFWLGYDEFAKIEKEVDAVVFCKISRAGGG